MTDTHTQETDKYQFNVSIKTRRHPTYKPGYVFDCVLAMSWCVHVCVYDGARMLLGRQGRVP